MKKINQKKNNIFKRLFIKVCRLFNFEIIDQTNLDLPVSRLNFNDNLSKIGKNSLVLPMGKIQIKRPVKSLQIILRTCASVTMLTQSKNRIFNEPKYNYTLKTLNSLINSINYNKDLFKHIRLKLTIIDHNSDNETTTKLKNILDKQLFECEFKKLEFDQYKQLIKPINHQGNKVTQNQMSNMSNIHQSLDLAKNCEDLIYFVEDDYIHKPEAIEEMIYTYERISSIINKELILCPADYPYLYNKIENSNIFLGNRYHWRTITETLCTFLTSRYIINKHWEKFTKTCMEEHYPFEKPFHEIYESEICLSPLPSLAVHFTNINSTYGVSPFVDYEKLWKESKIND